MVAYRNIDAQGGRRQSSRRVVPVNEKVPRIGILNTNIQLYLAVAAGGALGTVGRYFLSGAVASAFGETFPWGTLIINVTGSLVIGFFGTLTGPDGRYLVSSVTRQFVMIGFCGGYTTFSSFSLQTLALMRDGEWLYAGWNIVGSVVLCLLFVWLGAIMAGEINHLKGA
jgi:CrcB protein